MTAEIFLGRLTVLLALPLVSLWDFYGRLLETTPFSRKPCMVLKLALLLRTQPAPQPPLQNTGELQEMSHLGMQMETPERPCKGTKKPSLKILVLAN